MQVHRAYLRLSRAIENGGDAICCHNNQAKLTPTTRSTSGAAVGLKLRSNVKVRENTLGAVQPSPAIDAVLRFKIVGVGRGPMPIQCQILTPCVHSIDGSCRSRHSRDLTVGRRCQGSSTILPRVWPCSARGPVGRCRPFGFTSNPTLWRLSA